MKQFPIESLNLQMLLVNPVHLFYLPAVLRRRRTHYFRLLSVLVVLFLAGAFVQHYAEGLLILALCLLIRLVARTVMKNEK